jgi:ComF family protein
MPSPAGQACGACLRDAPAFDRTVALWRYAPGADRLVHAFKYRGRLALAQYFARELAMRVDPLPAVDLIVPMPLARKRLAERGFNQAHEIAKRLGRLARIPVAGRIVRRTRDTADQTGLDPEARARNVCGAFSCDALLAGRRIAVVDDVMTTGASLEELARTLKRAGAVHVENWVLARTILDA